MDHYCLICTRNRPAELKRLLSSRAFESEEITGIVVVDSSASPFLLGDSQNAQLARKMNVVESKAGLPLQRQVGFSFLKSSVAGWEESLITFLDDDVEVSDNFFADMRTAHSLWGGVIGAWDSLLPNRSKLELLIARFFPSLVSRHPYGLAKSGLTSSGRIEQEHYSPDWIPGHSFSVLGKTLDMGSFPVNVRMTGEDIEFQASIKPFAELHLFSGVSVEHRQSQTSRESLYKATLESDLFRVHLALAWPRAFSLKMVYFATFGLIGHECLRFLSSRGGDTQAIRGHLHFCRIAFSGRRQLKQAIEKLGFSSRDEEA